MRERGGRKGGERWVYVKRGGRRGTRESGRKDGGRWVFEKRDDRNGVTEKGCPIREEGKR